VKNLNYTGREHWWVKDQDYKKGWVMDDDDIDYYAKIEAIPEF